MSESIRLVARPRQSSTRFAPFDRDLPPRESVRVLPKIGITGLYFFPHRRPDLFEQRLKRRIMELNQGAAPNPVVCELEVREDLGPHLRKNGAQQSLEGLGIEPRPDLRPILGGEVVALISDVEPEWKRVGRIHEWSLYALAPEEQERKHGGYRED
jgi:hypothetical protein